MKVTIKDVAKEANVATSTVSRVLSNSPKISEKTKEKVHEAIKKLNYKPNAIARSLANNKTRILGVVLPEDADDILNNPKDDYTKSLLDAVPSWEDELYA